MENQSRSSADAQEMHRKTIEQLEKRKAALKEQMAKESVELGEIESLLMYYRSAQPNVQEAVT
jgi:hypothetical protein